MQRNTGGDRELLKRGRAFLKCPIGDEAQYYESDQMKKLPMPHLSKPATGAKKIALQRDFSKVLVQPDFLTLLEERMSHRNFKAEAISLDQLAFLLWSAQGVTGIRGNGYATFRTAPSGGARHPFETYLTVHNVEGLEKGIYHYLPLEHELEFISPPMENYEDTVTDMLCGQAWWHRAGVVFYFAAEIYRAEWRYCTTAHRVVLMDVGHAMQNLYLGCHAVGLGTCALAAYDQKLCDKVLGLDGEEEFTVYAAPVGVPHQPKERRELLFR